MITIDPSLPVAFVDDDEVDRLIISRVLERSNLANEVLAFESARATLEHMRLVDRGETTIPGLILSDINMPELSGFDLLRELRGTPKFATVPVVVMLSSSQAIKDIELAIALGATGYLAKASGIDAFVHTINKTFTNQV